MPRRPNQQLEVEWGELLETALTAPGRISEVYSRFYNYSFGNMVMLMLQGVDEPVNTLKRWNSMNRRVIKGSRAASIMVPLTYKEENERGEEVRRLRGFKLSKSLFTVSQTEGDPIPPVEPKGWDLETAHKNLDIKRVPFVGLDGNMQGYSRDREYAINPVAGNPTKTTFHEIGHIVLGHTTEDEHAEYQQHRGVKEFQVESTAYLTMNELGELDEKTASESRGYISSWLKGERPEDVAIRQVFTATDQILRAGRVALEGA